MAEQAVAALSGGVDSAVAAALLKDAGFNVTGIHMRLWPLQERPDHPCCGEEAVRDAREVCAALHIRFYVLDFQQEFRKYVYDHFTQEYSRGRTPNPCIVCNQCLKFGFLLDHALALDIGYLATGHYARVTCSAGSHHLLRALHREKDQSYVLYTLGQEQLKRLVLPLGGYSKAEVRQVAREKRLPVSEKPDSQDVCFVYQHSDHLSQLPGQSPGDIVDRAGHVLGRHRGIAYYTVGQRHGLAIKAGRRMYVIAIDPTGNRVIVGDEPDLLHRSLRANKPSWVSGAAPTGPLQVAARIRYRSPDAAATVSPGADGVEVRFDEPQRAITPGQAVVFYQGDEVLGGATIESAFD